MIDENNSVNVATKFDFKLGDILDDELKNKLDTDGYITTKSSENIINYYKEV